MIEFRCTGCQALLRTKEDAAGRPFNCPKCGAPLTVPSPEMPSAAAPPPFQTSGQPIPPSPSATGASPFGPPPPPSPWSAPPGAEVNPYQSPQAAGTAWQPPQRRNGMAVASIVLGATSIPFMCCCSFLGMPLAVAGLVTGILGLKSTDRGLAIGGIVLSSIGLLLTAASVVWAIASMAM